MHLFNRFFRLVATLSLLVKILAHFQHHRGANDDPTAWERKNLLIGIFTICGHLEYEATINLWK